MKKNETQKPRRSRKRDVSTVTVAVHAEPRVLDRSPQPVLPFVPYRSNGGTSAIRARHARRMRQASVRRRRLA